MGASWLEIESLLKQLDEETSFPHAEALMPVTRARDTVAEAAMLVSRAGVSGDRKAESEAQDAMARARVTLHEAQVAVRRANEAVIATRDGCERAGFFDEPRRALRARDGGRPAFAGSLGPAAVEDAPVFRVTTALVLRRA